jgi:diguanylate cyclase (GGDEF)-like protein
MTKPTACLQGELTVSDVMATQPAVVSRGTTILQVAELLGKSRHRHVLVSDDGGRVAGVISSNDLLYYLAESSSADRSEWATRTVEAIMTTHFLASRPEADASDITPMLASGSIHCVPVLEDDQLVGVLTADDLLFSWNRLDPVLKEAAVDPVTGLLNRTTFNHRLDEEWSRSRRQGCSLAVTIIDIDEFKQINDSCGHPAGDAVLRMVGVCLKRQLRSYDVVARFAGDEFAAICVDCNHDNIDGPVRRLQRAVHHLSIPAAGRRQVTLSVGVAVISSNLEDSQPADLIQAADACLYKAKRDGRDRAYLAEIIGSIPQDLQNHMQRIGELVSS